MENEYNYQSESVGGSTEPVEPYNYSTPLVGPAWSSVPRIRPPGLYQDTEDIRTRISEPKIRIKDSFMISLGDLNKNKKDMVNVYSAGILPFYVKNKTVYFLLGKDPDGNWSDFGGRSEINDKGSWYYTAAREFFEETVGSIMDIQTILTKLQIKKNNLKINDKTLSGHPYYMYVLKVPYKETYRYNFKSTYSFIKYTNTYDRKIDYKYLEKTDIQWISLETIKKSMSSDTEYPLRSIFKRTLEGNLDKIVEFCSAFNEFNDYVF
jgi:hypothetical protein